MLGHLDKSHVTAHTYPEYHPETCIATFRVDIDVETCGEITPLSTLDYLIGSFDSDIITLDYRVRGFTRGRSSGKKLFIDHDITSIQDYIDAKILARYDAIDINVYQANLFHTNMLIKELDLQNYLFNVDVNELPPQTRLDISSSLRREMIEIFGAKEHLIDMENQLSQARAPIFEALRAFPKSASFRSMCRATSTGAGIRS